MTPQPAAEAVRAYLRRQLTALQAHEQGVREDRDPEDLHDFRVACRRSRSLLQQFKILFPPAALRWARDGFAWLSDLTGPVRDLDILLQSLSDSDDTPQQAGQNPLLTLLLGQRAQRRQQLVQALSGPRYRAFMQRWQELLTEGPEAPQDGHAIADRRLRRLSKRVHTAGAALAPTSPDEDFHALRKQCKKLRYLLEFLHQLDHDPHLARCIKRLKKVQTSLGRLQDATVQIALLQSVGEGDGGQRLSADVRLAVNGLVARRVAGKQRQRKAFLRAFPAVAKALETLHPLRRG